MKTEARPSDFKDAGLLAELPWEALVRDCPTAMVLTIRHRGAIYHQGDPARRVYWILAGTVTLSRVSPEGATITTAALGAGACFGQIDGAAEAEDTARAKGTVTVWQAPLDEFRSLLLHQPALSWGCIRLLAERQRQMARRLEGFAFKRTEARLAETFRELSGGFATRCEHGFGLHLRLTQQELADLVGASRPVVSTILNRLRKEGVIGYNREYVCVRRIEDLEQLIE